MRRAWVSTLMLIAFSGCGGEDTVCVESPEPECAPAYSATYSAVYENTIAKSCTVGGGACHDAPVPSNGLSLQGEENSLNTMLERGLVLPGDPSCSELFARIADPNHPGMMPPGAPLSPEEVCAVGKWIEEGALP